jgi:hypothetical protein
MDWTSEVAVTPQVSLGSDAPAPPRAGQFVSHSSVVHRHTRTVTDLAIG